MGKAGRTREFFGRGGCVRLVERGGAAGGEAGLRAGGYCGRCGDGLAYGMVVTIFMRLATLRGNGGYQG